MTSNIEAVRRRNRERPETFIEVSPADYDELRVDSAIDCNVVIEKPLPELVGMVQRKEVRYHRDLPVHIFAKLKAAVPCQLCCGARNQRATLERREGNRRRVQTFSFAVVIRCLLRLSNELLRKHSRAGKRAMEVLNPCIGGGSKRDPTTDLRGIENS